MSHGFTMLYCPQGPEMPRAQHSLPAVHPSPGAEPGAAGDGVWASSHSPLASHMRSKCGNWPGLDGVRASNTEVASEAQIYHSFQVLE